MARGWGRTGVSSDLATIFRFGVVGNVSDSQLLQWFLTGPDGAEQAAFAALVDRHGPMVLRVCRQVLGNQHDAQDAFQATFLVMARTAGSLHNAESLASWLHGIARRIAARARADEARRKVHERRCATMKESDCQSESVRVESWPELHEEIARLPERYRAPVVLCYLEGLSPEQAAARIGCPPGTVWSRLSRARERLRVSLVRRGVALPAVWIAAGLAPSASAALSPALVDATVRGALGFAGSQAANAALASVPAIKLARRMLYALTVSRLNTLAASALACTLALGGAHALLWAQAGVRTRQQDPAPAVHADDATDSVLSRSVNQLERELDETARRNAEMQNHVRTIRAELKAQRAGPPPSEAARAAIQFANVLKEQKAEAVGQLAGALKRYQPPRRTGKGEGTQVYMVDLVAGGTTMISDESVPGRNSSGSPTWSADGSRILFDATPGNDWHKTHVMSINVNDGRPTFTDLGPGNCPTISPDGKKITFLLNPDALVRAESGVWVMEADGSHRRLAGPYGAPFWSGDGRELLINTFDRFTETTVMNFEKLSGGKLAVPGYRLFSWPSWAGPGRLVASLGAKDEGDTIALLDVGNPAEAKIIEVLWQRDQELDVEPRWPVYSPETRRCIFSGVASNKKTLYSFERGKSRRAKPVEATAPDEILQALSFSPDGRYLLFSSDRP
jgi:RNA polymerase sigma factor (sigma-70 family)